MLTNITMMKRLSVLMALIVVLTLGTCAKSDFESPAESSVSSETPTPDTQMGESREVRITITVGGQVLTAALLDNATAKALVEKLPLTLAMDDLYSREMCYHFPDALPADEAQTTGYEVGEIIYWPPRHSLVILYAQNNERFYMQKIGRIDAGVGIFEHTGDVTVTFALLEDESTLP